MSDWAARGARFLAFGVINTLVTYAIYCLLVIWLHPQLAYALVFALGILLAYFGNAAWVFRTRLRVAMLLPYAGIYGVTYLANAALIHLLMTQAGVGPRGALAIALVVVTPLSFLLNHAVLGRNARPHA